MLTLATILKLRFVSLFERYSVKNAIMFKKHTIKKSHYLLIEKKKIKN